MCRDLRDHSKSTKGLFALRRKIVFGVCKKIQNFLITNFSFELSCSQLCIACQICQIELNRTDPDPNGAEDYNDFNVLCLAQTNCGKISGNVTLAAYKSLRKDDDPVKDGCQGTKHFLA